MCSKADDIFIHLPHPEDDTDDLRLVPFIQNPAQVSMDETPFTFRNIQRSDSISIYQEIQDVIHHGEFPRGQLPTYKYFYYSRFKLNYGVIVENESGEFVAYSGIGKASYVRSVNPHKICTTLMVISKAYRQKGFARKVFPYVRGVAVELGYVGLIGDTMITHLPALEGLRSLGVIKIGIVPNTDILGDQLTDSVLTFDSYRATVKNKSFTKLVRENKETMAKS